MLKLDLIAQEELSLRKWCVQQALHCYHFDGDGNSIQRPLIPTSQEIYDWIKGNNDVKINTTNDTISKSAGSSLGYRPSSTT